MKSSIKIDFADSGNGLQPVIRVSLIESDDTRDSLLKAFFQKLGGESNWLMVSFDEVIPSNKSISIHPIAPHELEKTIMIIKSRLSPTGMEPAPSNRMPE